MYLTKWLLDCPKRTTAWKTSKYHPISTWPLPLSSPSIPLALVRFKIRLLQRVLPNNPLMLHYQDSIPKEKWISVPIKAKSKSIFDRPHSHLLFKYTSPLCPFCEQYLGSSKKETLNHIFGKCPQHLHLQEVLVENLTVILDQADPQHRNHKYFNWWFHNNGCSTFGPSYHNWNLSKGSASMIPKDLIDYLHNNHYTNIPSLTLEIAKVCTFTAYKMWISRCKTNHWIFIEKAKEIKEIPDKCVQKSISDFFTSSPNKQK